MTCGRVAIRARQAAPCPRNAGRVGCCCSPIRTSRWHTNWPSTSPATRSRSSSAPTGPRPCSRWGCSLRTPCWSVPSCRWCPGARVVEVMRRQCSTPAIIGVGPDDAEVAVQALSAGASACVARPYRPYEVLKLLGVAGPSVQEADQTARAGGFSVNPATFEARIGGRLIQLRAARVQVAASARGQRREGGHAGSDQCRTLGRRHAQVQHARRAHKTSSGQDRRRPARPVVDPHGPPCRLSLRAPSVRAGSGPVMTRELPTGAAPRVIGPSAAENPRH